METLLVVDDDQWVRELMTLAEVLNRCGRRKTGLFSVNLIRETH